MKKKLRCAFIICLCLNMRFSQSQNETNKWYFGAKAGLDFMTNPPTALANGTMTAIEGCATMSDANGNLLFYSNGIRVWNQNHLVMNNGATLFGHVSSSQGVLIEKQPGSNNLYYIFTVDGPNMTPYNGFAYSIVDMSLAAGMGSVTVANVVISPPETTEQLTSTPHCNGIDKWIIIHENNSANFKAFLLTASGINSVAVVSTVGPVVSQLGFLGYLKPSPNGKKLAAATHVAGFYLYDFDNSTGTVSNPVDLFPDDTNIFSYGIEFSPGGTKLYGTAAKGKALYQWDLCAGTDLAIIASRITVHTGTNVPFGAVQVAFGAVQRASDGKIYAARNGQSEIGVINNPDLPGSSCNYVDPGISVAPANAWLGLPNFNLNNTDPSLPFTYTTVNCNEVTFSNTVTSPTVACVSVPVYSLIGQLWNFGDPASGSSNASTLNNPMHIFSGVGSYTTQLILYYSCGRGTDTLRQTITITNSVVPTINVSGTFTVCAGSQQLYTASGANAYSWSTGGSTQGLFLTPTVSAVYTVTGTLSSGCSSQKTFTVEVAPCIGINEPNTPAGQTINIFPNPNSQFVFIECTSPVNVLVTDQQGQIILKQKFEAGSNKMDLENLSKGLYFLSFEENKAFVKKLIKQ